jgi:hypothetical protein
LLPVRCPAGGLLEVAVSFDLADVLATNAT